MTRIHRLPNQCPRDRRNADRLSGGIKGGLTINNVTIGGTITIGADGTGTITIGSNNAIVVTTGGDIQLNGVTDPLYLERYTDATRPAALDQTGRVIWNADDNGLNISDGLNWFGPTSAWVLT